MLDETQMDDIRQTVETFWRKEVRTPEFVRIAAGKEIGHKIGDMVDETTTQLLKDTGKYLIAHQKDADGDDASRSMGDLWMLANEVYNPVNVKGGEFGKNGQPNLVSLKRVLSSLAGCLIDSYYLLIMKVEQTGEGYVPHVYFVDMLDFLDYTTFNSGPGQMMLKESHFYKAVDKLYEDGRYYPTPRPSLADKVAKLFSMLEAADKALATERDKKRTAIKAEVALFDAMSAPVVRRAAQIEKFKLG